MSYIKSGSFALKKGFNRMFTIEYCKHLYRVMYATNDGSCMLKNGVMYATSTRSCMWTSKSCMLSIHDYHEVMYA